VAASAGARVIAVDESMRMLAHVGSGATGVAAADVLALPFRNCTFDAVLGGFLLNHLSPVPAIKEMARVLRPNGVMIASTWAYGPDPVKSAIDAVIAARGWSAPAWYRKMKVELEPCSGDPSALAAAARRAGLVEVRASVRRPDLGVRDPRDVVAYRLAVPHIAPWLAALDETERSGVTREALAAVRRHVAEWRPAVVVLSGRAQAQPSRPDAARSSAPA